MILSLSLGIDDYPGSVNDLRGCVADACSSAGRMATEGSAKARVWLNDHCTLGRVELIPTLLQRELAEAEELWIWVAMHGTRVPSPLDPDGQEEAICFYDGLLLHDRAAILLSQLPRTLRRVLLLLDCCHAAPDGPIRRSFVYQGERARFMPQSHALDYAQPVARIFERAALEIDRPPIAWLAACRSTESAYEIDDPDVPTLRGGIWTRAALDTLERGISLRTWHERITEEVASGPHGEVQHPQMGGDAQLFEEVAIR